MKIKNPRNAPTSRAKKWPIRIWAVVSLTALMTVSAPISAVKAPPFDQLKAFAEDMDYQKYAAKLAFDKYGWGAKQFDCLDSIWTHESHWNPLADNPNSTAFGIAQMLGEDSRNGLEQISNGLRYIEHRYENPCNAWLFWQKRYWY